MSSMTLQEFVEYLPQMRRKVLASVRTSMFVDATNLIAELQLRSPVDKDVFRKDWRLTEVSRGRSMHKLRVQNRVPYGIYLDQGGVPGDVPWYWPSAKNRGPTSRSGKLTIFNGKVWAGGKSPSGFVIGGIVDPVIFYNEKRKNQFANNIADAVIGAME